MKDSKISSAAATAASGSRRPAANLHQVKKRDETKQSSRPRRVLKSHLCWYVPYNPDVSRDKVSGVRHIKWKCPPSFGVDPNWLVACGEESHEAKHQNNREKSVDEALYPCLTAIPPSPLTAPSEEYNDVETRVIPLIPIEDLVEVDTKAEAAPEAAMVALEDIPIEDLVEVDTKVEAAPEAATTALEDIDKLSAPDEEYNDVEPLIPIEDLVEVDAKAKAAPEAATAALEDIDKELIKILCNQEKVKKPKGDGVRPPPPSINRAQSHHHHSHNHHQLGGMQRQVRAPIITPNSCSRPRPTTMSVPIHADINRLIDDHGRRQQHHASTIIPPSPPNWEEFMSRRISRNPSMLHQWERMPGPQYPSLMQLPPISPMMQQLPPLRNETHERFGPAQHHHHNYIPGHGLGLGLRPSSPHHTNHPASSVVSPKPNCVYFATSRGCRNGSKCRFKHQRGER